MVNPPSVPTNWGWMLVIGWVLWQIYAPKYFGVETRFEEVVNGLNDRIDAVGSRLDDIESRQSERISNVEERQRDHIDVTEIIATETDNIDGHSVAVILGDDSPVDPDDVTNDTEHNVRDNGTPTEGAK